MLLVDFIWNGIMQNTIFMAGNVCEKWDKKNVAGRNVHQFSALVHIFPLYFCAQEQLAKITTISSKQICFVTK